MTEVLLLHGLGGDRAQSLALLPRSAKVTPIAPDLPGHGTHDLGRDEPVSFEAFADRVAGLLDGPVPVVGISMGAGVALTLASRRPELVRKLVLIRPSWLDEPPLHLAPFGLIARLLREHGPQGVKEFVKSGIYRSISTEAPAMANSLLAQFHRPHATERARVLTEIIEDVPLDRAGYGKIAAPAVVMVAPHDPVHPADLAVTMTTWLPGARLHALPRKVENPVEHQDAVQRAVAAEIAC